jgi:hypothetical protein
MLQFFLDAASQHLKKIGGDKQGCALHRLECD